MKEQTAKRLQNSICYGPLGLVLWFSTTANGLGRNFSTLKYFEPLVKIGRRASLFHTKTRNLYTMPIQTDSEVARTFYEQVYDYGHTINHGGDEASFESRNAPLRAVLSKWLTALHIPKNAIVVEVGCGMGTCMRNIRTGMELNTRRRQ